MAEEKGYNVIATEKGVPVKAWTKRVPLEEQARAAPERRATSFHFQVGRGHAGRTLGHRRDGWQRHSYQRSDYSGCGGRGHWLRHDGGAREGDMGIIPGSMGARSYIVASASK